MEEVWRQVIGYQGLYEVSNFGNVRSIATSVGKQRAIILKPQTVTKGYKSVRLYDLEHKGKTKRLHRLVWEAFNGEIPYGMQVNHIDENKANNALDNLNLMTNQENINWGTGNERRSKTEMNRKSHSKPVICLSLSGEYIAEYPSQAEAYRKTGTKQCQISNVCTGKINSANGYKWMFKTNYQKYLLA